MYALPHQTLPEEESGPKWQQDWGLIGNNPGVRLFFFFFFVLNDVQVSNFFPKLKLLFLGGGENLNLIFSDVNSINLVFSVGITAAKHR